MLLLQCDNLSLEASLIKILTLLIRMYWIQVAFSITNYSLCKPFNVLTLKKSFWPTANASFPEDAEDFCSQHWYPTECYAPIKYLSFETFLLNHSSLPHFSCSLPLQPMLPFQLVHLEISRFCWDVGTFTVKQICSKIKLSVAFLGGYQRVTWETQCVPSSAGCADSLS